LYGRNSSPSWPSTATSATSSAGLSHAPSPTPTTLSALDSSQFQETLSESIPEVSRASTPQSTTTKTKRKRTAWVYSHMVGTTDMQVVFTNDDGVEVWPCKYCAEKGIKKEFVVSAGTKNIEKHLENKHSIYESSPREK
jgi:hypothetical protein